MTDRRADYTEAQLYCRSHGGSLASMRTTNEMVFLNGLRTSYHSEYNLSASQQQFLYDPVLKRLDFLT